MMFLAEMNPILKNALIYGAVGGVIGGLAGAVRWFFTKDKNKKE